MAEPSSSSSRRAPTLADVGREASVSAVAASVVLNGAKTTSRISQNARRRILDAAQKLNYRPNNAARALVHRRMNVIGVSIVFDKAELNHYFLEVFNGVLEQSAKRDQSTAVFTLQNWMEDASKVAGYCDGRIDGMILIAPTLTQEVAKLLPLYTPFVALHSNEEIDRIVNIESNEEQGAYDIVKFLTQQGHRRIMHMGVSPLLLGGRRRAGAYRRALSEAGIEPDPDLLIETHYDAEKGKNAMREWILSHQGQDLPSAIFCANDALAVGCMEVLAESGIRVPDDISVCGFDDALAARTTVPQLTTVRQPLGEMGNHAVDLLLNLIESGKEEAQITYPSPRIFETELVHRASVGPPPARAIPVPAPTAV